MVKDLPAMRRPGFDPSVGKIPWRREKLPTPVFWPGHKESDTTERLTFYEPNDRILILQMRKLQRGRVKHICPGRMPRTKPQVH